jgi:general stress protein YciG
MAGTRKGGLKTAETNKAKYGDDFYKKMGAMGGKISRGGGFAADRQRAIESGRKGGRISKRGKAVT